MTKEKKKPADSYFPALLFFIFVATVAFAPFKIIMAALVVLPLLALAETWEYQLSHTLCEERKRPIYCVSFNQVDPAHKHLFASCGERRATIYECQEGGAVQPLQGYLDESVAEEFYTVRWSIQEATGAPLLLVAGKLGVVRVLNCHDQSLLWTAIGHGGPINDIAVHPERPDLFFTASKDTSLRLWNLKTLTCVLLATGEGCHSNEVLSIDFHPIDPWLFTSGGMDDTVKIWWLKGNERDIEASYAYDVKCGRSFKTGRLAAPIFSTHKVHWNYVDCVRWMGDLVLSKSVDSRIIMWRPLKDKDRSMTQNSGPRYNAKGRVHLVQEFHFAEADIWFLRFSADPTYRLMACGTRTGKVYVWDLTAPSEEAGTAKAVLQVKCRDGDKCAVRQTAVSHDGAIILACCDNSTVCRFDLAS